MDEILLKNRLSLWKFLAEQDKPIKRDPFIQFMIYWLIFDGYMSEMSGASSDKQKRDWFYGTDTSLRKQFEDRITAPDGKRAIAFFVSRGGVKDMRPNSTAIATITDPTKLSEVLDVVYQVRCNLFHGAKDRFSGDDESCVRAALDLIEMPIRLWFIQN